MKLYDSSHRGVVTTKNFTAGDFVVEYAGECLKHEEGRERQIQLEKKGDLQKCYFYEFYCKNKRWW